MGETNAQVLENPNQTQVGKQAVAKKSSKKKKKDTDSSSESDSDSDSSQSSGSSHSSSTDSGSESGSSTDGEIKKSAKLKKKQSRKERRLKKASSSSGSESSASSTGEINEKKMAKKKKVSKGKVSSVKSQKAKRQIQEHQNQKVQKYMNGGDAGCDSDGSMLDLRENLKPIGMYIRDRERMLDEMLRCIKGQKLQAMLPDILKNKSLEEIRARCLDELDIMSKKRIKCLLNDEKMLSSSGTEEDSTDELSESDNLDSRRIKGENLKNFNQKQTASKFKPLGVEAFDKSPKAGSALTPPIVREETAEHETTASPGHDQHSGETLESKKSASGIAAAGFKTFVGKKPISIKISSIENESNISAETRILKENKHISKKRSQQSFVDVKMKTGGGDEGFQQQGQMQHGEQMIEHSQHQTLQSFNSNNNAPSIALQMSESEKLRMQINQYNIANPNQQQQQQQQHHHQQQYNIPRFQAPPGHHIRSNQQPGLLQAPYAIPVVPPPTFAIPPPNMPGQRIMPGQLRQPYNLPPPQQFQQPPPNFMNMPFNASSTQLPPHLYNQTQQQHPQQYQQMQQHMLGIQGNLPGLNGTKLSTSNSKYDDEIDNLNVNDDAYDLDDDDLLLTDQNDIAADTAIIDKKEKHRHRTSRRSRESRNNKASSSHKSQTSSRSRHKRKHSSDSNFSDDYDEDTGDQQDLEGIKDMLISILTIHIENDQEDSDEDLKATLQSLLTQITDDDGSLSFEELSQLHSTIKSLTEENEESSASSEETDEESEEDEEERRRRRKRSEPKASREELRTSRKKRKYAGNGRGRSKSGGKRRHKSNNREYDEDSSFERSRVEDANEVEAGEIDDVCEDQFAVEKEFEDLLSYNKSGGGVGMMAGSSGNSGQVYHRHGNGNLQQQQMLIQQQQQQQQMMIVQQQQIYQQGHNGMAYNGNMSGVIGSNSYQNYNQHYGNQHSGLVHKNVSHQGGKNNNASGIY